jgi:hypothetical protein
VIGNGARHGTGTAQHEVRGRQVHEGAPSSHRTAPNSSPSAPVLKSGSSEKGATAAPLWRLATAGALGTPPASDPNLELACIAWTSFVGRQVREQRVAVPDCADYVWDDGGSGSCSPPLSPRRTQAATTPSVPFRIRLASDGGREVRLAS